MHSLNCSKASFDFFFFLLQQFENKRNATSPNQSVSRQQEVSVVLHFFSLFLPGIFLLLTGGTARRAYQQLKEESHSFNTDSPIPSLFEVSVCLRTFLSLHLTSFRVSLDRLTGLYGKKHNTWEVTCFIRESVTFAESLAFKLFVTCCWSCFSLWLTAWFRHNIHWKSHSMLWFLS